MSETEELLFELEHRGFRFRVAPSGFLVVLPGSQLTPADRLAIKRHRDGLVRILWDRDDRVASFSPLFQQAFRNAPGSSRGHPGTPDAETLLPAENAPPIRPRDRQTNQAQGGFDASKARPDAAVCGRRPALCADLSAVRISVP